MRVLQDYPTGYYGREVALAVAGGVLLALLGLLWQWRRHPWWAPKSLLRALGPLLLLGALGLGGLVSRPVVLLGPEGEVVSPQRQRAFEEAVAQSGQVQPVAAFTAGELARYLTVQALYPKDWRRTCPGEGDCRVEPPQQARAFFLQEPGREGKWCRLELRGYWQTRDVYLACWQ